MKDISEKRKVPHTYTRTAYNIVCFHSEDNSNKWKQTFASYPLLLHACVAYEIYKHSADEDYPLDTHITRITKTSYDELILNYCKYLLHIGYVWLERGKPWTSIQYELLLFDEDARQDFDLVK